MQVFCPYKEPIKTARCLDALRLNKQIIECKQIESAFSGGAWSNHPVTRMYEECTNNRLYLINYRKCLSFYKDGDIDKAEAFNLLAMRTLPDFMDDAFCDQHKRRLYTKNNEHYKQWAHLGESQENWYVINGELIKYVNGKRL